MQRRRDAAAARACAAEIMARRFVAAAEAPRPSGKRFTSGARSGLASV